MDILKGPNKTVKETQSLILRIDRWRSKHVSDRQFLLLLAFVIGFLGQCQPGCSTSSSIRSNC